MNMIINISTQLQFAIILHDESYQTPLCLPINNTTKKPSHDGHILAKSCLHDNVYRTVSAVVEVQRNLIFRHNVIELYETETISAKYEY